MLFLKIKQTYKDDIVKVFQNGAVIKCPGLFQGEIIVKFENVRKLIIFAMIAPNPDLEYVTTVFKALISCSFQQCILHVLSYLRPLTKL
jgi:hypothetical protein